MNLYVATTSATVHDYNKKRDCKHDRYFNLTLHRRPEISSFFFHFLKVSTVSLFQKLFQSSRDSREREERESANN
jgi:hypothetical protein